MESGRLKVTLNLSRTSKTEVLQTPSAIEVNLGQGVEQRPYNKDEQNSNKGGDQLIGQQLNYMLVIFLYMEVLLFSNQKVPC